MKKRGKWLACLLAFSVFLQGGVYLFCTGKGLMSLFPLVMRTHAETFAPEGNAYVAYYDMRVPVKEAPTVVVGVDFSVAETCTAFLHLLRFMKQYRNFQTVLLADEGMTVWQDAFAAQSASLSTAEEQTEAEALPQGLSAYAVGLAAINATMPPNRKFSVVLREEAAPSAMLSESVVLMDRDTLMEPAVRRTWEGAGALCIEMKYIHCQSAGGERTDIALPFTGGKTSFSFFSRKRASWFYDYFSHVTNWYSIPSLRGDTEVLEEAALPWVILIAGGKKADWQSTT